MSCVRLFAVLSAVLALSYCADSGGNASSSSGEGQWAPANPETHHYDARTFQGGLVVSENGREIATIRTASPTVEQWSFVNGGENIVTKSRGNHGPATVELWETETGTPRDKVLAFAVQDGQPAWAARYAE